MLNKLSAALATTAFVLGASTAVAQSIPFAEVDTDGNMMLSNDELVAAFGAEGAAILMQDDADGNMMLSVQEIRVGMMSEDDVASPEQRAASDSEDDPDYREETADPDGQNDTELEPFGEEEDAEEAAN